MSEVRCMHRNFPEDLTHINETSYYFEITIDNQTFVEKVVLK